MRKGFERVRTSDEPKLEGRGRRVSTDAGQGAFGATQGNKFPFRNRGGNPPLSARKEIGSNNILQEQKKFFHSMFEVDTFKFIGAAGLVLISLGLLLKNRKRQDILYILGGICLEMYSIHIGDTIFIILQIIFTLSAVYDFIKLTFHDKPQ